MKKIFTVLATLLLILTNIVSISAEEQNQNDNSDYLTIDEDVCSTSSVKTYMSYKAITSTGSTQYKYIKNYMTVDPDTGILIDDDGFYGVALGSVFGKIGSKHIITLSSGTVLKVVKVDEKSDNHTYNGCYHRVDGSVIEFVIDTAVAKEQLGGSANGLVSSGNFNSIEGFKGEIDKIEGVLGKTVDLDVIESFSYVDQNSSNTSLVLGDDALISLIPSFNKTT